MQTPKALTLPSINHIRVFIASQQDNWGDHGLFEEKWSITTSLQNFLVKFFTKNLFVLLLT